MSIAYMRQKILIRLFFDNVCFTEMFYILRMTKMYTVIIYYTILRDRQKSKHKACIFQIYKKSLKRKPSPSLFYFLKKKKDLFNVRIHI